MSSSIPRFLLPRGYAFPHPLSKAVRRPWCRDGQTYPLCKRASTNAPPPKVIRLEMPTKFNPPSHGRRLKQQLPRHYGPELTQQEKIQQKTKKYPNMMPPPDSFMYWFITSRGVHVFITLGTLVLLAAFTAYENWKRATVFREQLPDAKSILTHPIRSLSQAFEVWKMDVARTTAETQERRKRDLEDVQKRNTYRKAHGIAEENSQGMGGWKVRGDVESGAPPLEPDGVPKGPSSTDEAILSDGSAIETSGSSKERPLSDWRGPRKPVKKWFGIW